MDATFQNVLQAIYDFIASGKSANYQMGDRECFKGLDYHSPLVWNVKLVLEKARP
jgi:hypothetical protein